MLQLTGVNQPTAAEQVIIDREVVRSNLINAWLENLKNTDAAQFENVRRLPFEEIAIMAGL